MAENRRAPLSDQEIGRGLQHLPGWFHEAGALVKIYPTSGWPVTLLLVNAIGFVAEALDHHPDLEVHWGKVKVRLSTHSAGGVTPMDLELARQIDDVAKRGLERKLIRP
jgi:4a-hydroxytetrahydrobiopterin dehydratase